MQGEHRVLAATSDRRCALELMQSLARAGGCLVEITDDRWLVLARCRDKAGERRLKRQVAAWAEAHPKTTVDLALGDLALRR